MTKTIEDRIIVAAPASAIWPAIADLAQWPRISGGLYPQASGRLAPGETLTLTIVLPGMKPQHATSVVEEVVPNTRLVYGTRALGGLLVARRFIELRPLGPDRTEIANGEHMGGLLGFLIAAVAGGKMRTAFKAMNEAIKAHAQPA